MRPREFVFGKDCREKIMQGITLMHDTVTATMGPNGRSVLIDHAGQVVEPTKDGVTVANEVRSNDTWVDMGCRLAREASQNCNVSAGDGTTSTIALLHEMCDEAMVSMNKRTNVIQVAEGMQKACDVCVEELEKMKMNITDEEEYTKVATIAAQSPYVGKIVAETFMKAGEYGTIDIQRGEVADIIPEHTDGMSFNSGWISPHFVTNAQTGECVLEDVPILVTDKPVKNADQLLPVMEKLFNERKLRKMLVVCDSLEGEAYGIFVQNAAQRVFAGCAVKAPSFGRNKIDILEDICALTGATLLSESNAIRLEQVKIEHLGIAKKIIVSKEKTVIIAKDNIEHRKMLSDRIDLLKTLLKDIPEDSIEREDLKERLATLTDGITVLKVGAQTETERHELRRRVEDAVRAVQSAKEEGVTPGGGTALLRCIAAVEALEAKTSDERLGIEIVRKALHYPTRRILEVAGIDDREYIVSKVKDSKGWHGYDFVTGNIADLKKLGIYDAKKVVRCALQNAVSCAKIFIKLDVSIGDADDSKTLFQKLGSLIGIQRE